MLRKARWRLVCVVLGAIPVPSYAVPDASTTLVVTNDAVNDVFDRRRHCPHAARRVGILHRRGVLLALTNANCVGAPARISGVALPGVWVHVTTEDTFVNVPARIGGVTLRGILVHVPTDDMGVNVPARIGGVGRHQYGRERAGSLTIISSVGTCTKTPRRGSHPPVRLGANPH